MGKLLLFFVGLAVSNILGSQDLDPNDFAQFEFIHTHIFVPACASSGCHSSESNAGDLDLSALGTAYLNLVKNSEGLRVSASNYVAKKNGWLRVAPGEPDRSFLVRKLSGPSLGEGNPMPSTSKQLNDFYMEVIKIWIVEGANK